MQHIEFFDIDHFENNYHRVKPVDELSLFIDFFWETKFDSLLQQYPDGFSDALFPNIGYTYLINLGTPFTMQVDEEKYEMKTDGFLPRHKAIECYHQKGNRLFGIKFKVSPVIFEKRINFSEYRNYIFPLTYLLDRVIISEIKSASDFETRVGILTQYFSGIVKKHSEPLPSIRIVTEILEECNTTNSFDIPVKLLADKYEISTRTLQRYFESHTSLSSKKALQILRIRKATHHLATSPLDFHYSLYGYYDHSHFYKHLKSFLQKSTLQKLQPHLKLLEKLHHQ
ncbi:MAG: helix-turn-helix domain-containing protein [Ginsengibacter sp.]